MSRQEICKSGFALLFFSLTLGAHAQRGLRYFVSLSVCLSLLQLASRTFIRPKYDTIYLADHVDGHVRTNLSENSVAKLEHFHHCKAMR